MSQSNVIPILVQSLRSALPESSTCSLFSAPS